MSEALCTDGLVRYRTRLLTVQTAEAFCRCLRANDRFTDVQTVHSDKAKGERRHFVTFRASSESRQADALHRQQGQRMQKALTEGTAFEYWLDPDSRAFYFCFNPASGQVYCTTAHSCDCPDAEFRASRAGLLCKHSLALVEACQNGTLDSPRGERRAA